MIGPDDEVVRQVHDGVEFGQRHPDNRAAPRVAAFADEVVCCRSGPNPHLPPDYFVDLPKKSLRSSLKLRRLGREGFHVQLVSLGLATFRLISDTKSTKHYSGLSKRDC